MWEAEDDEEYVLSTWLREVERRRWKASIISTSLFRLIHSRGKQRCALSHLSPAGRVHLALVEVLVQHLDHFVTIFEFCIAGRHTGGDSLCNTDASVFSPCTRSATMRRPSGRSSRLRMEAGSTGHLLPLWVPASLPDG